MSCLTGEKLLAEDPQSYEAVALYKARLGPEEQEADEAGRNRCATAAV
jgi:hypothetical protein